MVFRSNGIEGEKTKIMDVLNNPDLTHSNSERMENGPLKTYNNLLAEFKKGRMGYAAIAIIGQSCLGSVAVMLLLMHGRPTAVEMFVVFLITIFCMAFNASILAQLKSKIAFNLLILSVVFSCSVIVAYLV